MKWMALFFLMISSSAFASNHGYDLKMDLSMNGKHVSSPRMIVKAGEMGTIQQKSNNEETFIEVVATEGQVQNRKGILMNFTVGYIGQNGARKIVSQPQILSKENETAVVTVGGKDQTELTLSVVARRTSL